MKIGFLSDAHGNFLAFLEAIKILQQRTQEIFFLGDAIGYFDSLDVVTYLEENGIACILGNHEDMVLKKSVPAEREKFYRLTQHYNHSMRDIISTWPVSLDIERDGKNIHIVHGSNTDPVWGYTHQDTAMTLSEKFDLFVCGATHRPFIRHNGTQIIANIGSCGFPRDVGNLGSCGIYDTQTHSFEIVRFNISESIEKIKSTHDDLESAIYDVWNRV